MHTWLAWLAWVIWIAASRVLGIAQAIDQAEYRLFISEGNSRLIEFPELVPGDLSGKCDCFVLPTFSRFSLAISQGICESAAAIQSGVNRIRGGYS